MAIGQGWFLQRRLGSIELDATLRAVPVITVAAPAFAGAAYGTWWGLDAALGRGFSAQVVSVGGALVAGTLVYAGLVLRVRLREAEQIRQLLVGRLRRG